MKLDPATVSVSNVDPDKSSKISIGFSTADARYHIWWFPEDNRIDKGFGAKTPTLYKNSIHPHGHPEHFKTRYLDATTKTNAAICAKLIELAQPLIAEARAEVERKRLAEQEDERAFARQVARLDAAIERLGTAREPTQDMLAAGNAIFHKDEVPLNIWRTMFDTGIADDLALVLDFARRMRADHQT